MSNTFTFTVRQKQDFFDAIKSVGLNPANFVWSDWLHHMGGRVSQAYQASGYVLTVATPTGAHTFKILESSRGGWQIELSPGLDSIRKFDSVHWSDIIDIFARWATVVSSEINEVDPWSTIVSNPMMASNTDSYSHEEKFTPAEAEVIRERLKRIEDYIVEKANATPEQKVEIHQTFIYLTNKVEKTTKLDWKNLFVAEIVATVKDYAADHYLQILTYCNEQLVPFFKHLLKLN